MDYDITNEDRQGLQECLLILIDDYIDNNIKLYSNEKFLTEVYVAIFDITKKLYCIEIVPEFIIRSVLNDSMSYYFKTVGIPRSCDTFNALQSEEEKQRIQSHLEVLGNISQEIQKTDAWFIKRHEMLTASSIWKALDTQSSQNSLIYNKCQPINIKKYNNVNITLPFHHGHKYEPLSTQFYEQLYDTTISEWGCLPHKLHDFLGASPDGINSKYNNSRYGRLLEIKNIVNREINGIPIKKYWIQMQLQMEVTGISHCDFLETRFKEFETEAEFDKGDSFHLTDDGKMKGIFVQLQGTSGPVYKYPPFQCNKETFDLWYEKCLDDNPYLSWVKNIHWWLEEYSCVVVQRNEKWFKDVLPAFKDIWDTIIKERITGFDHRKPKKRAKKKPQNVLLKVRTESFSDTQLDEESK